MSDDFESINSRMPDLGAVIAQRIAAKQGIAPTPATPSGFDPYQAMLKKKEAETAPIDPATIQRWPEQDVKTLEDYCKRMGIVGFSSGRLPPLVALRHLKDKFGEDFTGVPIEERVPSGYEKMGSNPHGPNYPYSQPTSRKQILHG